MIKIRKSMIKLRNKNIKNIKRKKTKNLVGL